MQFNLTKSLEILHSTPQVLHSLLAGLSEEWTQCNEGPGSWSAYDVLGHLIHGEQTDWMPRLQLMLSTSANKTFEPFDRFAQFENSKGKTLAQLLAAFAQLRADNLAKLEAMQLNESNWALTGTHPALGTVTVAQLLATWTVHDLNHLAQIVRIMAGQYKAEVGPWQQYLGILNK